MVEIEALKDRRRFVVCLLVAAMIGHWLSRKNSYTGLMILTVNIGFCKVNIRKYQRLFSVLFGVTENNPIKGNLWWSEGVLCKGPDSIPTLPVHRWAGLVSRSLYRTPR